VAPRARLWQKPGKNRRVLTAVEIPTRNDLVADLKLLREKGVFEIDALHLPALVAAARLAAAAEVDNAAAVETLARRVVTRLSGGRYGDALVQLFGLDADSRALTAGVRRINASKALGCSEKTFRTKHEGAMLNDLARSVLVLCAEQRLRHGREQLAARHPVESQIAVQWIERFEAYYRMWTPIYAIGSDLTAYRSTLTENPRPYDRRFGTVGPEDEGYSQEEQSEGYARFALYHYAKFLWELRRFNADNGGLWLLSNADTELAVRDAAYRIGWHVQPFNERDDSYLRTVVDESQQQEMHAFLSNLAETNLGQDLHRQWQEWVATCECTWKASDVPDDAYFPESANTQTISPECQVHQVVANCTLYCELIDEDWMKVADWYQLDAESKKGVRAERLYAVWRSTTGGAASTPPHSSRSLGTLGGGMTD
jgi:hypothetical protein